MSRRPGVEVVEPTHERVDQALTADAAGVGAGYLTAWVSRRKATAIVNRMEDGATAEIARPRAWRRLRSSATLDDTGEKKTRQLVERIADGEIAKPVGAPATYGPSSATAGTGAFPDLLTPPAYERMP